MLSNATAIATIGVRDITVAREFYEKKLSLVPLEEDEEAEVIIYKSGNSLIEVYRSEYAGTNKATALTWSVPKDIDKEVKNLKDRGVTFEHYNFTQMKLEGDLHVMGEYKVAWFKDPDGNILSIHNQ
ncbi:MAG TPA: VOC family protein [Bacteriovoracaceae bacterium]|nr:VOC family protein [Bacteriovoracaceae bacterium]